MRSLLLVLLLAGCAEIQSEPGWYDIETGNRMRPSQRFGENWGYAVDVEGRWK